MSLLGLLRISKDSLKRKQAVEEVRVVLDAAKLCPVVWFSRWSIFRRQNGTKVQN